MRAATVRFLSFAYVVLIGAPAAHAQSKAVHDRPELAIAYDYAHSNAPAGGCGCFSPNGGSATVAFPLHRAGLSIVGDVSATHAGAVSNTGQSLTLSTFTGGTRYSLPRVHTPLRPFGQVLVGVAHATGSLVDGSGSNASNANAAFASLIGGGIDLSATQRFSIRLIEADYLVTTFNNGSNNHQNSLRLDAGVVFRF